MKKIQVKPSKPGLIVYDDFNRQIPAEGKLVKDTIHIRRRIKEGSLDIVKENPLEEISASLVASEPAIVVIDENENSDKPKKTSNKESKNKPKSEVEQ